MFLLVLACRGMSFVKKLYTVLFKIDKTYDRVCLGPVGHIAG